MFTFLYDRPPYTSINNVNLNGNKYKTTRVCNIEFLNSLAHPINLNNGTILQGNKDLSDLINTNVDTKIVSENTKTGMKFTTSEHESLKDTCILLNRFIKKHPYVKIISTNTNVQAYKKCLPKGVIVSPIEVEKERVFEYNKWNV